MGRTAHRLSVLAVFGACLAFASAADAARQELAHPAIVGGSQIAIGQAPWQVAVAAVIPGDGGLLCGGSILDSSHILTVAHCVFDSKTGNVIPAEDFIVRAGTSDLASPGAEEQQRAVTDVRPHPYYIYAPDSGRVAPDDVAVLTLQEPLVLGPAAAAIPLVSPGSSPTEGTPVDLTGFGEENPVTNELNEKLYSLGMTVGWPRECGGENDAVLICASSPSGTPCNGDSGSGLTIAGSTLVGVEDDYTEIAGKRCIAGAENAFANVAAPEIQDFLDGSEEPPRAPRGGRAVIREAPINDGVMGCEPGSWSEDPTFTYTFIDSTDGQVLQQGGASTYAVPVAEVGHAISCEVQASNAGGVGMGRTPGLVATAAAPVAPPSQATSPPATSPSPSLTGHVSLAGTQITVQSDGVAPVKLECVGEATCDGKLTLTARVAVKAKGRRKATRRTATIGAVSFSITGEETKTVNIKLDAAGRAALSADHGRLSASLAILELAPSPQNTQVKVVRLVQQKAHLKTKKGSLT
jgi:hypothetical protein